VIVTEPASLARLVRRSRAVAVACAAFSATVYLWAALRRWEPPDGTVRLAAYLGLLGLPIALAVLHQVLFRRLRWQSRHPPVAFLLSNHRLGNHRLSSYLLGNRSGRPAFQAAKPAASHEGWLIVWAPLVASRIGNDVVTGQDRGGPLAGVAIAVFLSVWVVTAFLGRPYLTIDADGIWLGSFRPRLIGWDSIRPPGPSAAPPTNRTIRVPVEPPVPVEPEVLDAPAAGVSSRTWDRLGGRGLEYDVNVNALLSTDPPPTPTWDRADGPAWAAVDLRAVAIDRELLAHAIRYYRANPSARATIGTEAGHAQLLATMGAPRK
jgi:hypothetical protein